MEQNYQNSVPEIRRLIDSAKNILVLTHRSPTLDSLAASLGLYLALSSLGKKAAVSCPDEPIVELANLVGVDKITNSLIGKNLIVSFPYLEGSIEKVSYNIEGEKFNLVIEPRGESLSFSENAVQFSFSGGNPDLIFVVDTPNLLELGSLNQADVFSGNTIVNIDYHRENTNFGKINIVDQNALGSAEIVSLLLYDLKINLDQDAAANLFLAIQKMSNNFSASRLSANTFEAAAVCLRAGAKREEGQRPVSQRPPIRQTFPPLPQFRPSVAQPPITIEPKQTQTSPEAPPDWLKPKIYKSSTLL